MPTIAERLETATAALEAAVVTLSAALADAEASADAAAASAASAASVSNRVDPAVTSWAQLAAVNTVALAVPQIKIWRDSTSGLMKFSTLLAGTDTTNTDEGTQRPSDYNASTNTKVWYNS
jgi:hypothetical protein